MRKFFGLLLVLGLAALVHSSGFDYINNAVAATAAAQTITIGTTTRPMASVRVINDGANEVYVLFFRTGETLRDAVASDTGGYLIKAGESYSRSSPADPPVPGYVAVSVICSAAEETTLRLWGQVH